MMVDLAGGGKEFDRDQMAAALTKINQLLFNLSIAIATYFSSRSIPT